MVRLHLGCGKNILDGWENYDLYPEDERVKYLDMNRLPYPFKDNSVDEILCSHVLEHLYVPIYEVMKEFHRILKPGGKLIIKLPINSNIVEHQKDKFNIYFFNSILENPVGEFVIRKKSSLQNKPLFRLLHLEKHSNLYNVVFKKRLGGEGDTIVKYKKDIILFIKYLPHRIHDLLFNGEITWVMEAVK